MLHLNLNHASKKTPWRYVYPTYHHQRQGCAINENTGSYEYANLCSGLHFKTSKQTELIMESPDDKCFLPI